MAGVLCSFIYQPLTKHRPTKRRSFGALWHRGCFTGLCPAPASLVQISKMAKTNGCDHQLRLFSVKPNHAGSGLIYQSHDVQSQAPLAHTFIFVTAGFPLYKGSKWNVTIKMRCIWLVNELCVGALRIVPPDTLARGAQSSHLKLMALVLLLFMS